MARKNHPETTDAGRQAKADAEKADSDIADQVQEAVDVETEQGYRGTKVDPRPNSDYSLESGPDSPSAADARRVEQVDVADHGG